MKQKKVIHLNFFLLPHNVLQDIFEEANVESLTFKSVRQLLWMIWIKKIVISEYRKSSFDNVHIFLFLNIT